MSPRGLVWGLSFALALVMLAPPLHAEGWNGTISLGYVGESRSGNEDSYRTQMGLSDGLWLEDLELRWRPAEESQSSFELEAGGFGDAEPSEYARLRYELDSPWTFQLDYDRREAFYGLIDPVLAVNRDEWAITRWRGQVRWDGWRAAQLGLDLRYYERSGWATRSHWGLNELVPLRVNFDQSMTEVALKLETKTLPVKLVFEQGFSMYERNDRYSPAGTDPGSSNTFEEASTTRSDEIDTPTSRLLLTYGKRRTEVAGSFLYSPSSLDSSGLTTFGYGVEGGSFGQIAFVDDLLGSADFDTLAGNLRFAYRFAPQWKVRLIGMYRDRSTDTSLLGSRILRLTSPLGDVNDIVGPIDDRNVLDVQEQRLRGEVEWSANAWSVWAGAFFGSRETDWRLRSDTDNRVTRDGDGFLLGFGYRPSTRLRLSGEYEHGAFDRYAFRTEPRDVDRLQLQAEIGLAKGFSLRLQGRLEEGENPREVAGLDHSADSYAIHLDWNAKDGDTGFGLGLDSAAIRTTTDLVLPNGDDGRSIYDLDLLTPTLWGRVGMGRAHLNGNVVWVDDRGDTWPVSSWIFRARVGFDLTEQTEISVFGEYYDYDEERTDVDDYDTTRYGVALRWSFE